MHVSEFTDRQWKLRRLVQWQNEESNCYVSFQGQQALEAWRRHGEVKIVVKGQSTEQLMDMFKAAKDLVGFTWIAILVNNCFRDFMRILFKMQVTLRFLQDPEQF